jgi:hypothetical protein
LSTQSQGGGVDQPPVPQGRQNVSLVNDNVSLITMTTLIAVTTRHNVEGSQEATARIVRDNRPTLRNK